MDISQVTVSAAMVTATRNLQAIAKAQMAVMKALVEGQQQMAAVIQAAAGLGTNINTHA